MTTELLRGLVLGLETWLALACFFVGVHIWRMSPGEWRCRQKEEQHRRDDTRTLAEWARGK